MKNYLHIPVAFFCFLSACGYDSEETQTKNTSQDSVPAVLSVNKSVSSPKIKEEKEEKASKEKKDSVRKVAAKKTELVKNQKKLTPQQKLLNTLDKSSTIEYATLDHTVVKSDTTVNINNNTFQIKYETSCLNDSLVAQEMYDYGGKNTKSYLISHNYQTDIAIVVNGQVSGSQHIDKNIFKNKLDQEFLTRSIIKHPQFVKFDEKTNEAIFEFIVGIPNTDWLVLAGVNLDEKGTIRIIDIIMPEL